MSVDRSKLEKSEDATGSAAGSVDGGITSWQVALCRITISSSSAFCRWSSLTLRCKRLLST